MLPVALLNNADNMDEVRRQVTIFDTKYLLQFCTALETMDACSISTRICASKDELALKVEMSDRFRNNEMIRSSAGICARRAQRSTSTRSA